MQEEKRIQKVLKLIWCSEEQDKSPLDNCTPDISSRTIPTEDNYPLDNCLPYNSHLFPPRIIDPLDRWPLGISHLGLFRLVRLLPQDRLCRLKIFYCLSFRLCHNKILYNHKHALFQNISRFPFRIINEIFELLSKVLKVLSFHSFWDINKFTSTKFKYTKVFSSRE